MNKVVFACALASALSFALPVQAKTPAPLPAAAASFQAGSVHVDRYGGPGKRALVFIPGLACGPWEWADQIRSLSSQYTVYALTLPGFDGQKPIDGPLFTTVANDITAMIAQQHLDRPILIGHSLGGTMSLLLATQHAPIGGVIALDGLPVFPGMETMSEQQRTQTAQQMSMAIAASSSPSQFEAAERTYVLPYMLTSPADVASAAKLTARSDPGATAKWMSEDLTLDMRPELKNITVPVLEIAPYDATLDGRRFASATAKQAYYASLLANDPGAKVQMIDRSRHFVMYDQPQALDAAIAGFLQSR